MNILFSNNSICFLIVNINNNLIIIIIYYLSEKKKVILNIYCTSNICNKKSNII